MWIGTERKGGGGGAVPLITKKNLINVFLDKTNYFSLACSPSRIKVKGKMIRFPKFLQLKPAKPVNSETLKLSTIFLNSKIYCLLVELLFF